MVFLIYLHLWEHIPARRTAHRGPSPLAGADLHGLTGAAWLSLDHGGN